VEGLSSVKFEQFFETDASCRTRGHSLKLGKHHCRLDLRQHFFSERVINNWNSLDQHTIDSSSLNAGMPQGRVIVTTFAGWGVIIANVTCF